MIPTRCSARLAGLTLSAALVFACGGEEPAPAPPAPSKAPATTQPPKPKPQNRVEKNMKLQEESVRFESESGDVFEAKIGGDVALPEGFPDDVPLYPGAKIIVALTVPGGGVMASFETADAPKKILDFYRRELPTKGWEVGQENSRGPTIQFQSKKRRQRLSTSIVAGDPMNKVTLTVIVQ